MNTTVKQKKSWLKRILYTLLVMIALLVMVIYWKLVSSKPQLEGTIVNPNLSAEVIIERDSQGLVTITSASINDRAFAMGYVHAQERFFQMDLLRRRSAGELSELFGERALNVDKSARVHRFRARAKQFIEKFPDSQKQFFKNYAKGVNAGLQALDSKPFEYILLRQDPVPWRIEDSLLTSYTMYFTLQSDNGQQEWQQHLMQQTLPPELSKFLLPLRSFWDAPIDAEEQQPWIQTPLPKISPYGIKAALNKQLESDLENEESSQFGTVGSNNWAVAGTMTETGSAIMADDMHLGLSVPNTWFRMRLKNKQGTTDINGVTLPGEPVIVAGSNTFVAWGFTNSYGDWGDLIQLQINPQDDNQYRTVDGYKNFKTFPETIKVNGAENIHLQVKETLWGPVVKGPSDELMAYKWVAHYPQGMNAGLLEMEHMKSVEQTLSIVDKIGIPAQNAMLADRYGNIAWTIFGAIPKRHYAEDPAIPQLNYMLPADWSKGGYGWDGWLSSAEYPRVKNPQNFRLWTANTRVVSGEKLAKIGDGHYALGARAKQIRDDLLALNSPIKETQLLQIQLDDRAIFLTRWQQLMSEIIENAPDKNLAVFSEPLQQWGARAAVDSIGYRLVKEFRLAVARKLFAALTAPCTQKFEKCNYYRATHLAEEPLWSMVTEKNPHWLPSEYSDWQQFFESIITQEFSGLISGKESINQYTWGNKNQIKIKHPLSGAIPGLTWLTDMPVQGYSGDRDMPKVVTSRYGASERMIISPSHEQDAILHMPTSQSGHPLSPYYGLGHKDWVEGNPTSLLPGKTVWTLRLVP